MGIDQRLRTALLDAGVEGDVLRDAEHAAADAAATTADRIEAFLGGPGHGPEAPTGAGPDGSTGAGTDGPTGDDPVGPAAWTPTTVYSDMDVAHSSSEYPEHTVRYADLFTHADEVRGYLRFESWGVPVTDGRILSAAVVELTLGPTVNGRIRFARDRADL